MIGHVSDAAPRAPILTRAPLVRSRGFWAAGLFAGSVVLAATTRDPVILAIALGIWMYAAAVAAPAGRRIWPALLLGVIFFYPEFCDSFSNVTAKITVEALLLVAFTVTAAPRMLRRAADAPVLVTIAFMWMLWALVGYAPVLTTYVASHFVGLRLPADVRPIYSESSALTTVLPVLCAPLALFVPIVAFRTRDDLAALVRMVAVAAAVLLAGSFLEYACGGHLVAYDPALLLHNARMTGFSMPDPNGLARLLLIPVLLLAAVLIADRRTMPTLAWPVFGAGLFAIALTESRIGYIALVVGLGTLAVMNVRNRRMVLLGAGAVALGAVAAFVLGLQAAFAPGSERLTTSSLWLRVNLWEGVIRILQANPWFGAHPGGYEPSLRLLGFPEWRIFSPHSLYFFLGAEWGIPMIVCGIALLATTLVVLRGAMRAAGRRADLRKARALAQGLFAIVLAYVVLGVTDIVPPLYLFFLAGAAVATRAVCRAASMPGLTRTEVR